LAGHAFFSYREPIREPYRRETIAKSQVSFLDREYLLKEYKGTLNIRTLAIHLPQVGQKEEIYFALSLGEDIENSATLKGTDSHFSCDQDYEFLLKAAKDQRLQIRVWKKRFLRPDELLGVCIIAFESFANAESKVLEAPLRGGSANASLSLAFEYEDFREMDAVEADSSKMILEMIGVKDDADMAADFPLLHLDFRPCCFISNAETDTQAWIWWNNQAKEVIVAFRGTEQTQWKDLLTDVKVMPTTLNAEGVTKMEFFANNSDQVMVHNGFLTAYQSVRNVIFSQIKGVTTADENHWSIYVTGHSLGGALATLFAYECSRAELGDVDITMYNYGSPRVGNKAFVEEFKAKIDSSWRFSNVRDIIPTVPRFLGYQHVETSARIEEDGTIQIALDKDRIGEAHFTEFLPDLLDSSLEEELLQKEMDLLSNLIDGRALQEHMEDQYLQNLLVLASALRKKT
jgi:hypothetical protein